MRMRADRQRIVRMESVALHSAPVEIALSDMAPHDTQEDLLLLGFDTFGDDAKVKGASNMHNGGYDRGVLF